MRLAHGQHGEAGVVGNGLAVQLVDRAGVELEVAGHGGGVGARLLDGLAGVGRFQLRQFFLAVEQREGDAHQQTAAGGRRHLPHSPSNAARVAPTARSTSSWPERAIVSNC